MPTTFQTLVKRTWRPPFNVDIFPDDHDKHYKPWGFTLYRTCYGPESNQQWDLLINNISTAVLARLMTCRDQGDDPKNFSIITENFKLDTRSDPNTLDGLTIEAVSQHYHDEVDKPMQMTTSLTPDHKIFLLADEETLQNLDSGVLKVVQAAPSGNDPECYFQWMRLDSKFLIDFWVDLENSDYGLWDFIWEEQPGALYTG
jgi:hypothetical protein